METPPTQNWKEDFQAMREQEPPDCWDMELPDRPASPQATVHKPWRGAATFIPKVPVTAKKQSADGKQVRDAWTTIRHEMQMLDTLNMCGAEWQIVLHL